MLVSLREQRTLDVRNRAERLLCEDTSLPLVVALMLLQQELLGRPRRLLREGTVAIWDESERMKKERYLFLFNDVLLITKKEGRRDYWLKVYISLRSEIIVEDVRESPSKLFFPRTFPFTLCSGISYIRTKENFYYIWHKPASSRHVGERAAKVLQGKLT